MQFLIEQNISEYVKKYSERILKDPAFYETDEGYKYKAVATFQKEFNLNASDLAGMLERSLKDAGNLVQSGQYFPKRMLLGFARKDSNFVRNQLKNLLKEDDAVSFRIDRFIKEMGLKFPLQKKKNYFDYRFLSFFLASANPKSYFYVKAREYREFSEMVDYKLVLKGTQGEKYEILSQLGLLTRDILRQNKDFGKVHELITSKFVYKDPSLSWGAFDFIFNIVRRINSDLDKDAKKLILWNSRIAKVKLEALEDLVTGEEVIGEVSNIPDEELLEQAKMFKPSAKEGHREKSVNMKVRLDNAKQKERIKKIEGYSCQVCNFSFEYINSKGQKRKYVEADHIIDKSKGGTEILDNLWVLCPNCHMKKTLGVIVIDPKTKTVTDNGKQVNIRDKHLNWNK